MNSNKWICSQFGAREFYSIPRMLNAHSRLHVLYTDLWKTNLPFSERIFPKYRVRHHSDLETAEVKSFDLKQLYAQKRNRDAQSAFDSLVAKKITNQKDDVSFFFTYSYGAIQQLKAAKQRGLTTVYGQINPGIEEANLVKQLYCEKYGVKYKPEVPTDQYWEQWSEELQYADHVVVNSQWSKDLLIKSGYTGSKIAIIPLVYESNSVVQERVYPLSFSEQRPMRVLYLGSLSVRKGFHVLVDAFNLLIGKPVELHVVGRLNGPHEMIENLPTNVVYHGSVSPLETVKFYQNADLFILPTFSDGFALTLLEAQKQRLPVLTTPFCGEIITHGVNGEVLEVINSESIASRLLKLQENPAILAEYSANSDDLNRFTLESIYKNLINTVS